MIFKSDPGDHEAERATPLAPAIAAQASAFSLRPASECNGQDARSGWPDPLRPVRASPIESV